MNRNDLVIDITHAFITQVAPDELPLFPGLSQIYRENPENITRPEAGKDEILGFGSPETTFILTTVVMTIVTEVLTYGSKQVVHSAVDASLAKCWNAFRKLFNAFRKLFGRSSQPKDVPKDVPNLTPEQLVQVREAIIEKARNAKLSEEQAQLLAVFVVEKLATAQQSAQL